MKEKDVLQQIQDTKPKIVYISGKTCTGKSTLANKLKEYGYKIIELDAVVKNAVIDNFNISEREAFITAYRGVGPEEHLHSFIEAAKTKILAMSEDSPIIIEGAIATPHILKEIVSIYIKDFSFIYLHPINIENYSKRISERFISGAANNTSGLPKNFWTKIQKEDLNEFINTKTLNTNLRTAILEYTKSSMKESTERLASFKQEFKNIQIIEI